MSFRGASGVLVRSGAALAAVALIGVGLVACDDLHVETFVASRYDPTRECLEPSGTVDVYEDDDPATCDAETRCWIAPDGDLFATTECEGAPGWEQTTASADDRCEDAIDAWNRGEDGRCDEE